MDLPAPVGTDDREPAAGGHGEIDALEDFAIRPIAEPHTVEPHFPGRSVSEVRSQRRGARSIGDLLMLVKQAEHLLHVHDALPDRHVDHAEEPQRLIKLHQVGVHQHELSDRHRARANFARRHQHDQRQAPRR